MGATNLVIVESPAKAKTIEKFLGKDFKVMSSFGHIRDLKKKNCGVDLETFEPQYEIPEDKEKVVSELRKAAKKVKTIWLASDEDREGEAISWHLAKVLQLDPETAHRIVFHEITKPAILHAIENPRHVNVNLVDAQQARRVLDRVVGFKISPILWRKVRPSLSAGRVQSVAVRLIAEREREIQCFKSENSFVVSGIFWVQQTHLTKFKAHIKKHFKTVEEARGFLEKCRISTFTIKNTLTKPGKMSPPAPFTTSSLQQEAARKLGFSVATTMRIAQTLYEQGHITYMRTDSMNLSQQCIQKCRSVILDLVGKEYHKERHYHTHAKGAQEAHEAIRPTHIEQENIDGTIQEQRLYQLIWKRTLASQMADAQLERTTIEIVGNQLTDSFTAQGEVIKFDGFLNIYRESENEDDTEQEMSILPDLHIGNEVNVSEIIAQEHFTSPPARYNEASLVHKLEELGIGRPSTYAPTISTIQQRNYVEKMDREGVKRKITRLVLSEDFITETHPEKTFGSEKKKLIPTDIGLVVNDFLMEFFPNILDYNFTANVEKSFDAIAEGKENWREMLQHFYQEFAPQVENTINKKFEHRIGERELGIDPTSGETVTVKIGKYGPMVQIGTANEDKKPKFAGLKSGQSIQTITLEEALELFKLPRHLGSFEDKDVVVNVGRFGPYILHNKVFTSIPKGEDPLEIHLDRAIEIIEAKRETEAQKHIKNFEKEGIEVLNGRFGPYIKYNKKNYKIPKEKQDQVQEITLEECQSIIEKESKKVKKSTRKTKK